MKRRRQDDHDESDKSDDSDSSSGSSEDSSRRGRSRSKKKKKSKKHHKRKHKKHSKHRKKHSRRRDDDSESTRSRKRRKKEKKSNKEKKHSRKEEEQKRPFQHDAVAEALYQLLEERPVFAQELPLILIRLAGGATFDLTQMTDRAAARGLHYVFESLESFGVKRDQDGAWKFEAPPGRQDELILLRVIRSLLDEIGMTMEAVESYEAKPMQQQETSNEKSERSAKDSELERIKELTSEMLAEFQKQDTSLGQQLAALCTTIAEGESISIDGLPDAKLKESLELIFSQCGLEKAEMENESDSDDDDEKADDDGDGDEPLMGFGLPVEDSSHNELVQIKLAAVMEACRNPIISKPKRILGPARGPIATAGSSDDEEGPALPGASRRVRGPALPPEVLKAQAQQRELELKATAAGVSVPTQEGEREEWMLKPGKFDFLSNIKSGNPMKSRGFENKKAQQKVAGPIHPAIQAEMDAIMEAHNAARGPSMFEQHRAKKQQEKKEATGGKQGWKWNRERDLDEGRRVDKDALHMVLGGAADNLKTKFQGGFR